MYHYWICFFYIFFQGSQPNGRAGSELGARKALWRLSGGVGEAQPSGQAGHLAGLLAPGGLQGPPIPLGSGRSLGSCCLFPVLVSPFYCHVDVPCLVFFFFLVFVFPCVFSFCFLFGVTFSHLVGDISSWWFPSILILCVKDPLINLSVDPTQKNCQSANSTRIKHVGHTPICKGHGDSRNRKNWDSPTIILGQAMFREFRGSRFVL